jgi:hypothetical protein
MSELKVSVRESCTTDITAIVSRKRKRSSTTTLERLSEIRLCMNFLMIFEDLYFTLY